MECYRIDMNLLLPSLAALVAIVILPGISFYFDVIPKVVLVLIAAACALWFIRLAPRSRQLNFFLTTLAAQSAAVLLATAFSTHPRFSFLGSTWRRSGAIAEIAVFIFAAAAALLISDQNILRFWLRITVFA